MQVSNESLPIDQTEVEIIHLLCKKYTIRQIASELNLSKPIIKNHLVDISDKIYQWKTSIIVANAVTKAIENVIKKPE